MGAFVFAFAVVWGASALSQWWGVWGVLVAGLAGFTVTSLVAWKRHVTSRFAWWIPALWLFTILFVSPPVMAAFMLITITVAGMWSLLTTMKPTQEGPVPA